MMLPLLSAVRTIPWQPHAGRPRDVDADRAIMRRDNWTCQCCGLQSGESPEWPLGHMEVHHHDGDHDNDAPENLATTCPLCHEALHVGVSGVSAGRVTPIWLPAMTQVDLNRLVAGLFMRIARPGDDGIDADQLYDHLAGLSDTLSRQLDYACLSMEGLATALSVLPAEDEKRRFLIGIRLLPVLDVFNEAAVYWSTINTTGTDDDS